ncbi:MAG TPA: fused MFS/spermidine synthase [Rhizomicrobium sp.]|jgi:SAM-dependent methyltransferase|nr:fused MFS/spermidine synthase [Rhizomicrobium sp.]
MRKALFGAAIFLSAFLLFWVQPLFSKMVLPLLGGSPQVWNTAMMFFQVALLAGYGYVHLITHRIKSLRGQLAVHGAVLVLGFAFLPFAVSQSLIPPTGGSPIPWLLGLLAVSVGWPFFALSASAPLVQSWFARSGDRQSADPYFLYAASNSGSLLALLAFPVLLEPALTLAGQGKIWAVGYGVLLAVLGIVAAVLWRADRAVQPAPVEARPSAPSWRNRFIWIALAFIPSSLLLGVTTYITTDIASAPLLWVLPLALYLLSFIVAFAQRTLLKPEWTLKLQAVCILLVATMVTLVLLFSRGGSVLLVAGIHLLAFFVTAVVCHTELARRRPGVEGLTEFYFCMSIGGALGGIFNALIAPLIFTTDYEYYLALAGACALRVFVGDQPKKIIWRDVVYPLLLAAVVAGIAYRAVDTSATGLIGRIAFLVPCAVALYAFTARPYRFAFGVAAMIGSALLVQGSVDVLHTERNFFGINRIKRIDNGAKTVLIHGTTMHGTEFTDPRLRREPLAYYARSGPAGQAMALRGIRTNVAAIGLGTGALACYRRPGESWTFFEIDGAVERIARDTNYFHYLADCGAGIRVVLGDGRLSLKAMPDASYDLVIIDAFSSDSIPMHLFTKEALALYLRKLKPHGVILFNVSNEYLDLAPELAALVGSVGAAGRHQLFQPDGPQIAAGASASEWAAIARTPGDLDAIAPLTRWRAMPPTQGRSAWTDDFSNIFGAIRW